MAQKYDYIVIGSGIVGLTLAYTLKQKKPDKSILIIDKEDNVSYHASSRNSGILHAGFYYTANSLKAQLTVNGNRMMKHYCRYKDLPLNECGKLVVAQNEEELTQLYELEKRGKANGSKIEIIDAQRAKEIEPNVKTYKKALWSPDTATVDPKLISYALKVDLQNLGVNFSFHTKYLKGKNSIIQTTQGDFEAEKIINCAGLYADKVAHDFGFGKKYTMIPFKGLYLKYIKNQTDVKTNIYPVPNLKNPFLGVHFTKTVTGAIKIGPTATPAFWRENYAGLKNFNFAEFLNVVYYEAKLFALNAFHFRDLAFEELKKYNRKYFIDLASNLVEGIDPNGFGEFTHPGIRAQLLNKQDLTLVQDFIIEGDEKSTHILNAVSPAFTCSFAFAEYVVDHYHL